MRNRTEIAGLDWVEITIRENGNDNMQKYHLTGRGEIRWRKLFFRMMNLRNEKLHLSSTIRKDFEKLVGKSGRSKNSKL
ncbi:MAG TPA: hypothetical protein PLD93_05440, partial [Synergistaceae bacterium]|nr:hypothetical protein [Synergistaceae bacterium]